MKYALLLGIALACALPALAQHGHGSKGPNGGPLEDVADMHAEFLSSGARITLNIFDEDMKPVPTAGFTASALVTSGSDRETLALAPQGTALVGEAKKTIAAGATVSVTMRTKAGKSGQVRFKR